MSLINEALLYEVKLEADNLKKFTNKEEINKLYENKELIDQYYHKTCIYGLLILAFVRKRF
jgi:hypothetical protein